MRKEDHDGEPVDEAQHHRVRHEADELAPAQDTGGDLQNAHEDNGGEEIFDPVLGHERDHDDGQRAGGARDHARPAADQRRDEAHEEGRVEAHERVNTGDEGEGHRLGHQRQRDGEPGKELDPEAGGGERFLRVGAQVGDGKTAGYGGLEVACHGAVLSEIFSFALRG